MAQRNPQEAQRIYQQFRDAGATRAEATLARDRSTTRNTQELERIRQRTAQFGTPAEQQERAREAREAQRRKERTPEQQKTLDRQRKQYNAAKAEGLTPQEAAAYRKMGVKRFRTAIHTLRRRNARRLDTDNQLKEARKDNWARWSATGRFPANRRSQARAINRRTGNTVDAKFGYRIAYRAYVNGQSIDNAVADYQNGVGSP